MTPESHVVAVLRAEGFDYTHRTLAGTYTCNANARAHMIDYVFYTEAFRAQPVAVPVIDDQTPLPSYDQPSDHLALMAHFDWSLRVRGQRQLLTPIYHTSYTGIRASYQSLDTNVEALWQCIACRGVWSMVAAE